jgi:prepilin-type N-terminal cleavage/methylation domain-containing protein
MGRTRKSSHRAGFSLIEIIVVLAVMGIVLLFSFPALLKMMNRGKLMGITSQTSIMMQQARFEAIKRNTQAFVIADYSQNALRLVTDDNGNGTWDVTTDTERARIVLPSKISFWGAVDGGSPDAAPQGANASSFAAATCTPSCANTYAAVYKPDGSVAATGAFRFGDGRGNFTDVYVATPATGRIEARKWDPTDSTYHVNGYNGKAWAWY